MNRNDIIEKIEGQRPRIEETIHKHARFQHNPLRAAWFYTMVAINRYTPFSMPIRAKTVWGDWLTAHETSSLGSIYFLGFYDIDTTLFLLKHFHEDGDILDIGSNIGYYALLGTQIGSPHARIIAFEPTPSTFALLQHNTEMHKNITTEQCAVAEQNGTTTLIDYGERNAVFNSTKAQPLDFLKDTGTSTDVKTVALDAYCAEHQLSPALIKLDTEGTEAGILASSHRILTEHAPIILLEVGGGEAWRDNTTRSLDILRDAQYDFFELNDTGELTPHVRKQAYSYQNLVCIPKSKLHLYVRPA